MAEPTPAGSDFTWDLVPDAVSMRIVQQLAAGLDSPADARAYLTRHHPVPDDEFLRRGASSCDVAHVIREEWPPLNSSVLAHLYGLAESHGLVAVGKRRPTDRTMVRRLGELRLQVNFRRAILDTLLRFGSRTVSSEALQELPSFFVVPTDAGAEPGELFPYQLEATGRLHRRFAKDGFGTRGLVVMPTGSGKTRTAVAWLLDDVVAQGHKVLWVTHRTELMEQTARAFVAAAPRLARRGRDRMAVRLVGGGFGPGTTIASSTHDVAIASVATLARNAKPLRAWLRAHDVVVVFDEAHHSPAKSWRDILRLASEVTGDAVVGLTATPTRLQEQERRSLIQLYGGEGNGRKAFIHESRIDELIDRGFLARPIPVVLETSVDVLSDATAKDLELLETFRTLSPRLATQLADNAGRNQLLVDTWLAGPGQDGETYGQTVVFAINIPHAELLASKFAAAGVEAAAVHSHNDPAENRRSLDDFRDGEVSVLVNVEMLTEGIDVPNVRSVFLARPTQSSVLFNQMIGRAMRGEKVGGTRDAHIVDLHDLWTAFPPVSYTDEPVEPGDYEPETRPSSPRLPMPGLLELALEFGRIHERLTTSAVISRFDAVPLGVLAFHVDVEGVDDTATSVERTLVVHSQNEPGFERIRDLVERGDLGTLRRATDWREEFFGDLAPLPARSDLDALRRHVLDTGAFPALHRFAERDAIDPEVVARGLAAQPRTLPELNDEIDRVVAGHTDLIRHVWGSPAAYADDVIGQVNRIVRGEEERHLDERRPRLRVPDVEKLPYGTGTHDLRSIVDDVLRDRQLFPHGLEDVDHVRWSKDPRSYWGLYDGDEAGTRIVINCLLDAEQVDRRVLSALVFHELLHHEQFVQGGRVGHGPDFRRRENQHPDIVQANTFLDTFHERFSSLR